MKYSGSIAGHLVSVSDPEITYTAHQTVTVMICQDDQILSQVLVDNIDQAGQAFELQFDYANLIMPIRLIFETFNTDDQFNRDNPITVTQLVLDDLFTIPHLLATGILVLELLATEPGNVLWKTGRLVYTFNLPIISGCRIGF